MHELDEFVTLILLLTTANLTMTLLSSRTATTD